MTNAITRAAAEWVDDDIAAGVLAADKREERIARRRARYSIAVHRMWSHGTFSSGGHVVREPSTSVSVYLQYGYQPEHQANFPEMQISHGFEMECGEAMDEDDIDFVRDAVASLRRDFGADLPTDIKPSVRTLNPGLVIEGPVAAANR